MPECRPPIDLQGISLAELQRLIDERRLPPVEQWQPELVRPLIERAIAGENQPAPSTVTDPEAGVTAAADAIERLLTARQRDRVQTG